MIVLGFTGDPLWRIANFVVVQLDVGTNARGPRKCAVGEVFLDSVVGSYELPVEGQNDASVEHKLPTFGL
jgi:hypothetical protein